MDNITGKDFLLFLSVILFVSGISVFSMLSMSRIALRHVYRFNYRNTCLLIIAFLLLFVLFFSGFIGLLICLVGLSIGILPPLLGVKRSHCMGVLLLPIMIWYM